VKLSLGTVQLGLDYGVNNSTGVLTDEQADAVLDAAVDAGFSMVDTSLDYGKAVERIARFLERRPGALEVVMKYDATLPPDTIRKLQDNAIIHSTYDMLWTSAPDMSTLDPSLADGVTVYTVDEAYLIPKGFDLVQVPASILDDRMDMCIRFLKERGQRVFVRSLLLQGLIAADPAIGPVGTNGCPELQPMAQSYLEGLRGVAAAYDMSVTELAVRWAWEIFPDVAIIGGETPDQVRAVGEYWHLGPLPPSAVSAARVVRLGIPEVVISPRMWNQSYAFTTVKQ